MFNNYKWGKKSLKILDTVHVDLIAILNTALRYSPFDLTLLFGNRSQALQFKLFQKGRKNVNGRWRIVDKKKVVTYKDGYRKKSKHNYLPSPAVDIGIYIQGNRKMLYDRDSLIYLAGLIESVSKKLYNEGRTTHLVRWGGNFDQDNIIIKDQSFIDLCHWELYKPKGG